METGKFEFLSVPVGAYTLKLNRNGFGEHVVSVLVQADTLTDVGTQTLMREGNLQGLVTVEGGLSSDNVAVSVVGESQNAQASANGSYTLLGVNPGLQTLRFEVTGNIQEITSSRNWLWLPRLDKIVEVNGGMPVTILKARGSITGVVTLDNYSGDIDVLVQIPSQSVAVLTNPDGSYSLTDLPVGFYDLTFQRAGYQTMTANNQPVTNAGTTVVDTLALEELLGSISGQVVLEEGTAFAGIEVSLTGTNHISNDK